MDVVGLGGTTTQGFNDLQAGMVHRGTLGSIASMTNKTSTGKTKTLVDTGDTNSSPRKCACLATRPKDSVLDRAKERKVYLREGASLDPGSTVRGKNKATVPIGSRATGYNRIKSKSAKCGIILSDDEVRRFSDFMRASS